MLTNYRHNLRGISPCCAILLLNFLLSASVLAASNTRVAIDLKEQQYKDSLRIGKRIYNLGLLPSGKPLSATVQGDVKLSGNQVSCVNCHKRSGMGSSESRRQILPINKQALFDRTEIGRSEVNTRHLQSQLRKTRPSYTDSSLRTVIREGIDPNGRILNPLMPKFSLDDTNLNHLINYIKSLSLEVSPGVTDSTIHFATIVTDEVEKSKQDAMLDILSAFTRIKNANTRNETGRAKHGPFHKEPHNSAYRKWALHTWRLMGAADTWRKQLKQHYETQPVFAILNGISTQSWAPIHHFCNDNEIPCLFPNTDLPVINENDFYSVYFSKGLTLEAKVLAKYILKDIKVNNTVSIIQVHGDNEDERFASKIFRQALEAKPTINIKDFYLEKNKPSLANLQSLLTHNKTTLLVLWLRQPFLTKLEKTINDSQLKQIFLSASLLDNQYEVIPTNLYDKILLTYPFGTPNPQRHLRMRSWSRLQHVDITHERIQANAFFTAKTVSDALMHIRTNLYRDYFLERIEHMIDRSVITSVYARLSLAPGQRFVSKGSYIVKLSTDKNKFITPVSEWIIP
ncbi:MAG: hypothetical protein ACC707_01755 [Thiohalomonadales bacterium]